MPYILSAEQIVEKAENKSQTVLGQRREINRLFRAQDDSPKLPIRGKFHVTERAIRKARWFEGQSDTMSSLEYASFLEAETSNIVNNPKNW